jgi:hypothetical protein
MERTDQYIENELSKIGRVNPPPFLLTRIEARIEGNKPSTVLRPRLALAALIMLVLINVLAIGMMNRDANRQDSNTLWSELNIQTSNQLYHE